MKTTTKLTTSKIKSITDEILLKVDKHMYYNHDHEERSCVMAGVKNLRVKTKGLRDKRKQLQTELKKLNLEIGRNTREIDRTINKIFAQELKK